MRLGRGRVDRPLALLAAIAFVVQIGVSVMLPLLPLYAVSLGATPFMLGLLTSSFAVANTLGGLSAGFLAGRFQPRRLVAGGLGFYAVANVLIATATAAIPLIGFRTLSGFGGGLAFTADRLYLTSIVDRSRLAASNGILSAAGSAGSLIGPVAGGLLAAAADVRLPFLLVGLTSLIGALAALFLPRPARPIASTATAQETPLAGSPGPAGAVTRILVTLFLVQLGFNAAFGAFITTYGAFASQRLTWSTTEISWVFGLFALGSIVVGPWLARLADRHGRRDMALLSCALIAIFPLAYLTEAPRLVLYAATIIAGAGVTGLEASWFALLGEATDGGRRTRVFGAISSLANLGIVVGATAAAQLWGRTTDVGYGLVVVAIAMAFSAVCVWLLPRDRGVPAPVAASVSAEAIRPVRPAAPGRTVDGAPSDR